MVKLSSFIVEAWIDTDSARPELNRYDRLSIRIDRPDDAPGLRRTWFILMRHEVESLISGTVSQFEDGYHRLSISGDLATFYDLEMPRDDAGDLRVPYVRVAMPRAFWRHAARLARAVWRGQRAALAAGGEPWRVCSHVTLPIDVATVERLGERFAQGSGSVRVGMTDRLAAEMDRRPQLRERVERVSCIARNSTRCVYQTARVEISNDGEGYYWRAIAPSGRMLMNGGIVNHARGASEDDWSIHT